ncbi:MAG: hypothetical protein ACK4K9_11180 [Bacteroidia bacterium]
MLKLINFILLIFFASIQSRAQSKHEFSNKIFNFQFTAAYQFPTAYFANRFGNHTVVGFGGIYKSKSKYFINIEGNFLFGSEIKEQNIFNNIATSGGFIAASNGLPGDYSVNMRGWAGNISGGKLFPVGKFNHNHGLMLTAGAGFLNHYIGIFTQRNDVAPLAEEYRKGYDRNTFGFALNEFAGYYFNSKNRFINFYAGIQFMQGFTKNVRGFNYDTMKFDNELRNDFAYSFKFGWLIPIYLLSKDEDEFIFK